MELLWDCGRASIAIRRAAHPDALAHRGEHTDGQAGLVARLVLGPLSVQSVCMRLCPPGEWERGRCGETAKWKLSGCRMGVAGECEWPRGCSVQMGGCNVCLLNRCFRRFMFV